MLSMQERSKLISQWKDDDVPAAAVIVKCVAGLLVILGIAVLGVYSKDSASSASQVAAASSAR